MRIVFIACVVLTTVGGRGWAQTQITDIAGLETELQVRPSRGPNYIGGRTAVINDSGELDGASGDPQDCVRVDGTAAPCSNTSGEQTVETPNGPQNGSNRLFSIAVAPEAPATALLFRNGLLQKQDVDYTLAGNTLTFKDAVAAPEATDILLIVYRRPLQRSLAVPTTSLDLLNKQPILEQALRDSASAYLGRFRASPQPSRSEQNPRQSMQAPASRSAAIGMLYQRAGVVSPQVSPRAGAMNAKEKSADQLPYSIQLLQHQAANNGADVGKQEGGRKPPTLTAPVRRYLSGPEIKRRLQAIKVPR
jgi:hypothetical protein